MAKKLAVVAREDGTNKLARLGQLAESAELREGFQLPKRGDIHRASSPPRVLQTEGTNEAGHDREALGLSAAAAGSRQTRGEEPSLYKSARAKKSLPLDWALGRPPWR